MLAILPLVGGVLRRQFLSLPKQKIFSILFFGRFREIERPGQDRLPVNDHDLVVSNRMPRINEGRNAGMNQERRRGIPLCPLALIEQNLDSSPKNCYEAVGTLFKTNQLTFINSFIHTYPHLIPRLGVVGWG